MDTVSFQTWFAVRYVHVVSAALLMGGGLTICGLSASTAAIADSSIVRRAAALYERVF